MKSRAQRTIIDEEKLFTPYRLKKEGKKRTFVFSDHCAMVKNFNITTGTSRRKYVIEKTKHWILTEEGLARYQALTQHDVGIGDLLIYDEPFTRWHKTVDDIMHQCFDKKTVKIGGEEEE